MGIGVGVVAGAGVGVGRDGKGSFVRGGIGVGVGVGIVFERWCWHWCFDVLVGVGAGPGRAGTVPLESRGVIRVVQYIVGSDSGSGSVKTCVALSMTEKTTVAVAGWVPATTTMAGTPWVRLKYHSQTWKDQRIATQADPTSSSSPA